MTAPVPLASLLEQVKGVSCVDDNTDRVHSIVNNVVRCVYEGRRAVAVRAGTKSQTDGLLDLVDLHLSGAPTHCGTQVAEDEVVVLLGADVWDTEAEGALRTLAAELRAPFRVTVRRVTSRAEVLPITACGLDDIGDHEKYRYTGWLDLLMDVGNRPSALVDRLLSRVPRKDFRAYPMLGNKGRWSLRLEGLEVAQLGVRQGWVNVGRQYEGRRGPERSAWLGIASEGRLAVEDDDASVARAADHITRFADAWDEVQSARRKHNEHALESRILRGVVPIRTSGGVLETLQIAGTERVSWGSQFPTRWGRTSSNGGRYLDALLRDGTTPWALEIKIENSSGVAGYYRHAVQQAVLYRHFIRNATYFAPWFERFGLDHSACRAAVVVPEFRVEHGEWPARLQRLCDAFDVELVTVPEHFARVGRLVEDPGVSTDC